MRLIEVIFRIGKDRVDEFLEFMKDREVGVYKNKEINYYDKDVEDFLKESEEKEELQ